MDFSMLIYMYMFKFGDNCSYYDSEGREIFQSWHHKGCRGYAVVAKEC